MSEFIYFARPIDFASDGPWRIVIGWIDEVLAKADAAVFRPAEAFRMQGAKRATPRVESVNRQALSLADRMVVLLPAGVTSIGVPREIEAAKQTGTPVAVITDLQRSFSLSDADLIVPMSMEGMHALARWLDQPIDDREYTGGLTLRFAPVEGVPYADVLWPTRKYDGDAGYDLFVSERTVIPVGQFRDVPTGVRAIVPDGMWLRIIGRSSTMRTRGLLVTEGVIDTGWRGPLFAGVQNIGPEQVTLERGDRIAQVIPHLNLAPEIEVQAVSSDEFDKVPASDERGTKGFGSTGR